MSLNSSGTYDITALAGPSGVGLVDNMGIFYVPPGSPQFSAPSVLLCGYYRGPIGAYTLDSAGNPAGTMAPFIAGNFSPYGAAFDPITGDMLFTTTLTGEQVYEVQGFHPATLTATAGSGQSAIAGKAFAAPLTVTLQDAFGNPIGGVQVDFAAPGSGATATLSNPSAITAADGTASVTAKANSQAGTYNVTASLYQTISTTFSLTNAGVAGVTLSPASVLGGNSTTANSVTLTAAAPSAGANITLASSDPAVAAVPASVMVAGGSLVSAPFTVTTTAVAATQHVSIKATAGASNKAGALTVKAASLAALSLSPKSVTGGKSTSGNSVTLNGEAPPSGAQVSLSSSDPAVAAVQSSVTVAAGATSATFTITTTPVATQTAVTISASYGGVTKTATVTVNPPQISAVTLSPASLTGGTSSTKNSVTLNGAAPLGGTAVMLTSSNPGVAGVPATVTVTAGATSAKFMITTTPVGSNTIVVITGTAGGATKMANLTVVP